LRRDVPIRRYLADEGGATAIEYGIICGMIAVVVLGIAATGGALDLLYQKMAQIAAALLNGGGGGGG
jgi:pilus assembly protein Flp/PilA